MSHAPCHPTDRCRFVTHRSGGRPDGLRRRDLALIAGSLAATPAAAIAGRKISAGGVDADLTQGGVLKAGVHRITRDTIVRGDLVLEPGACIDVAPGRTLTILGYFSAPIAPVFVGGGMIDLNHSHTTAAYPEWWGATGDDGTADCLPPFQACLAAHPVMLLRAADYYLSDSFVIERPYARIWGTGYRGGSEGQGTRILVKSGSADVLRVGPVDYPGAVNNFLQGVDMRWLELGRTAPVSPGAAGLRAQYLLHCHFEGLSARESSIGFAAKGVVRSYFQDCIAFRSLPGAAADAPYRGFQLGGVENVGLAGVNGSIFLIDCNVSIGGSPEVRDSVGLLLEGGFADSFIERFEATSLETGIRVDGMASQLGDAAIAGHSNLHIRGTIIDQCSQLGIDLRNFSDHALIDLHDVYVAVASGAQAAIAGQEVLGTCSIIGGQLIGRSDRTAPGATGLSLRGCSGLDITGLKIADFGQPVRLSHCRQVMLHGQIHNPGKQTPLPALIIDSSSGLRINCAISGRTGAFSNAVVIDRAREGAITIEAELVDARALAGAIVLLNGSALKVSGQYGKLSVKGL